MLTHQLNNCQGFVNPNGLNPNEILAAQSLVLTSTGELIMDLWLEHLFEMELFELVYNLNGGDSTSVAGCRG